MRSRWLALLLVFAANASALDSIVLVRHAEKLDGWPASRELDALQPLSAQGMARAQRLAELLADEPILAVFASATTRSLSTGLPTASAHGVELEVAEASVRAAQMAEFLDSLRERFPGPGSVLIVGHSNTVPQLLRALGADEECDEALGISPESYGPGIQGFDGLWRVDLAKSGCSGASRSSFGEAP